MKSFNLGGHHYSVPTVSTNLSMDGRLVFEVVDSDCKGMRFTLSNLRLSDDGTSITYDLTVVSNPNGGHVDILKPLVDNYILHTIAMKGNLL